MFSWQNYKNIYGAEFSWGATSQFMLKTLPAFLDIDGLLLSSRESPSVGPRPDPANTGGLL
jgi:hypothetical protein